MLRLNKTQIQKKIDFIESYISSANPADGSPFDPNANVEHKNIATMEAEINKDINIQVNREIMRRTITEMYGENLANEYITSIENKECYIHDETRLCPYTYGSKEVVVIKYKENRLLMSLESIYEMIQEEEFLLDENKGVWGKYPKDLYVMDKDGWTTITRLVKKVRHRDLVRVKTAFGEDLIVTDNHPLIISDDKNNTIEAISSLGRDQLKIKSDLTFKGVTQIDLANVLDNLEVYDNFVTYRDSKGQRIDSCKRYINLTEELGYAIGFFIAEGYHDDDRGVSITQNDTAILEKVSNYFYNSLNIAGRIYEEKQCPSHNGRTIKHTLDLNNRVLNRLLTHYFKIGRHAQNKNIPLNILDTNDNFAYGIISGLIDGDGSVKKDGQILIRLASRYCISQLQTLLPLFNFSACSSYNCQPFSNNTSYKSNYPIFGISFYITPDSGYLCLCEKTKQAEIKLRSLKYKNDGWVKITSNKVLENSSFLDQNKFIYDITTETNTFILNNVWVHNCVSVSLYPLLLNGTKGMAGESKTPKHLNSFCGSFINLAFALSSQFAGAVATTEYLLYFDYFARKDYGQGYLDKHSEKMANYMQQVVYSINQPAAARGFQSVFWNISIFDRFFAESLFQDFRFPDGSVPDFASLYKLQEFFMTWFNKERERSVLTFPVVTAAMVSDGDKPKDTEFAEMCAEQLEAGNSFFVYMSESVDSLASCCRLRNELVDNTFSYTLGAGGVATGSINVITININRLVYNAMQKGEDLQEAVTSQVQKIHKYHLAYKSIIQKFIDAGIMPAYNSGYITLSKQFMTIGINGLVEAAETYGLTPGNNDAYKAFLSSLLKPIYDENRKAREEHGHMFNTECVPAENLGVKNAKWDKKHGMDIKRDCYNSYFYPVEDESINMVDKFILHGKEVVQYLDGGSALHLNLEEYPSKQQYLHIFNIAAKAGCNYFTTNIKVTVCNSCGYINKKTKQTCVKCGSNDIDHATRIIGYLKRVGSYSKERKEEHSRRHYHKGE